MTLTYPVIATGPLRTFPDTEGIETLSRPRALPRLR